MDPLECDRGASSSWWYVFCSVGRVRILLHIILSRWSSQATNSVGLLGRGCCLSRDVLWWVSYEIVPSIPILGLSQMVPLVSTLSHILQVVCKLHECHTRVPFLLFVSVVLPLLLLLACCLVCWWLRQIAREGGVQCQCYLIFLDLLQVAMITCREQCEFSRVHV